MQVSKPVFQFLLTEMKITHFITMERKKLYSNLAKGRDALIGEDCVCGGYK